MPGSARVGARGVAGRELLGGLAGDVRGEAPGGREGGEFVELGHGPLAQLAPLLGERHPLGVAPGGDRDVLPRRHRHRPGEQPGETGREQGGPGAGGPGDADDEARRGDDAVVGAEDRGPEPVEAGPGPPPWASAGAGVSVT